MLTKIDKPFFHICNKSLSMGIFPEHLKYTTVKPLYKKGDTPIMANYRPVFLLMIFSQVVEAATYHTINQQLKVKNILVAEQYGLRRGLSTENEAGTLIDITVKAWNSKLNVGGIFCDLAKVFDSVIQEILIMKLQYYGLQEENINWFKSYLFNSRPRMKLNIYNIKDCFSTWERVKQGVPQGSVVGPLLLLHI
jgi:hypothetical protein